MRKLYRILLIDGGGIRGIIPAQVLVRLERKLQAKTGNENARIADYFDFIAGTSTGGILACVYLCPDYTGKKPKYTAEQAVKFYCDFGSKIFKKPKWYDYPAKIKTLLKYPKYSSSGLDEVLRQHVGDTKLNELLKPCLITAYNIESRETVFLTQHDARSTKKSNYYVRDVARATSAAPTFFPPALIKPDAGRALSLIDGGVFANNPSMCAFAEARKKFNRKASNTVMLSLGTGKYNKCYPFREAHNWGSVQWILPLLDIMMSGVSETIDYQMQQLYESVDYHDDECAERTKQYLRVNADLPASSEMDDASDANIDALVKLGEITANDCSSDLDDLVNLLIK